MADLKIPAPPTSTHKHVPLENAKGTIIYTETDEAPALATYNLYPIVGKIAALAEIDMRPCDISVAGRVLGAFPEFLKEEQRIPDNLAYLGEMSKTPEGNIIKLPNISAPLNQMEECIKELRARGFEVPIYPREPKDDKDKEIQKRYKALMGSAVNPVLREGNSDRRVAPPVKAYAQKNPHRLGKWNKACRSHVAHMSKGDFFGSEKSTTIEEETAVIIELKDKANGEIKVLKPETKLMPGEVIDAGFMSVAELKEFFEAEMNDSKANDILFSLHLKATMMKVSDPIMFGHCVKIFFKDAWDKHAKVLADIGANANLGLTSVFNAIDTKLDDAAQAKQIKDDFDACYEKRPWLAMVNSDKGITNLHAPNDIIIDASMPVVVRDSGKMWNKENELEECKCVIPDRSYATMYQEVISYVKTHGQFDVSTMGNVSNVGLMAKKAEEYGSHDKTFEIPNDGTVMVRDLNSNKVYFEHEVQTGDIWRMCQCKQESIKDWVKLAVSRAKATGAKTIFWLNPERAHDAVLIPKVNAYLKDYDITDLDISIMKPVDAVRVSMERCTQGLDSISVTGNVLRDYLTDLFPILELGTSAKMLSIVPLLAGGGLYETGAGGSAPKHVQQFVEEGHLRWDSLGEYLALSVAFEKLGTDTSNKRAIVLGNCLNQAVGHVLDYRKSPSRVVNQQDNRATNFYIALYWSRYLSEQTDDAELAAKYKPIYDMLTEKRSKIVDELKTCQGKAMDLGGYYKFDYQKAYEAMNPSKTLKECLDSFGPKI